MLNLALQEQDNKLCVVYRAEYDNSLPLIRPFISWLALVELEGVTVPRFIKVKEFYPS